jgi:hypothetical protein
VRRTSQRDSCEARPCKYREQHDLADRRWVRLLAGGYRKCSGEIGRETLELQREEQLK